MRIIGVAMSLALLVTGCGSVDEKGDDSAGDDGGDDAPTSDFSLVVDPTALTMPIASSTTVTVTVERDNFDDDITLTAESLPANLAAVFAPATLTDGATSAELTVTAIGGMAPGTGSFEIVATAGSASRSADLSVTTTTITVSGKVRGAVTGATVGLVGKAPVTTGAGGLFTFTDVIPPYDIYVVGTDGQNNSESWPAVNFYKDVTRPDPVVTRPSYSTGILLFFCQVGQICSSTVSGNRAGAGSNTDTMLVGWSKGGGTTTTNGSYSFSATGFTSSTSVGTLHALQYTKSGGAPATWFYGSTNATITTSMVSIGVGLAALNTTSTVTGTISPPAGFPAPTIQMTQQMGSGRAEYAQWTSSTINAVIPSLGAGFNTGFVATSTTGGATTSYAHPLAGVNADVTFTMSNPSVQTAPVQGATGVTTATSFAWTGEPNTIFAVTFRNALDAFGATFTVYTTDLTATIPAIAELPLPGARAFAWRVSGYPGHTNINEALAPDPLEEVYTGDFEGPPHAYTVSASRSFTTQ